MINLASRDVLHGWGKFLFTGIGLGLLIGATLTMAGVFRGMVDDGQVLIDNSGADLWVVQQDTLGPYAESSSLPDDAWRRLRALPGVEQVVPFGTILHLSGSQAERLEQSLAPLRAEGLAVEPAATSLEDVFIHLMQRAKDNYR